MKTKNLFYTFVIVLSSFIMTAQDITFDTGTNPFPSGFDGGLDSSIAMADINSDGTINNICIIGYDGVGLFGQEYINDGTGNFTEGNLSVDPNAASDSAYADFDNDGDFDYVDFGSNISGIARMKLLEKTSSGDIDRTSISGLPNLFEPLLIVALIDGDNLPDIFVAGRDGGTYFTGWFHNNGDFTFTLVQTFVGLAQVSGDIGDVDGDGDEDIILSGNTSGQLARIFFLEKNGNTNFSSTELSAPNFLAHVKGSITFGYDNDGDTVVDYFASSGHSGGNIVRQFKKNNGSGLFSQELTIPFPLLYEATLLFVDANNNGKSDLFAAGWLVDGQNITVAKLYENTNSIDFVLTHEFDGFADGTAVFGDFNGDSLMDLLYTGDIATVGIPIIRLYLNQTCILTTYYADVDGDGEGDPADTISTCDGQPVGYVSTSNDTDPNDACLPVQSIGYTGYDGTNSIWRAGDCDGDTILNGEEYDQGYDPYDPDDYPLGVEDFIEDNFVIAPNPVGEVLHFKIPSSVYIESIEVFDFLGRRLVKTGGDTREVYVGNLPTGTYIVRIISEQGASVSKKILKQ